MKRFFIFIALAILVFAACQPRREERGPEPLETEVVEPPPEAALDLSQDARLARRAESLAGVLPSDAPKDLPLYRPATLVDFGSPGGARHVTFTSPAPPAAVQADLEQRWRAGGWSRQGTGEPAVFTKDGRRVTLTVESDPVGSLWRIDY